MSRNSRLPHDSDTPTPCARDRTQVMPIDPGLVATARGITQILPVGCDGSNSTELSDNVPPTGERTLILARPSSQISDEVRPDAAGSGVACETAPKRLQHTLVWPQRPVQASATESSGATDATDVAGPSEASGPITRIARPSEWLPSAKLATLPAAQQRANDDSATAEIEAADGAQSSQLSARDGARYRRAFDWFSTLSPLHKASLALSPLATIAAVFALHVQSPTRSLTERHTLATKHLAAEGRPIAESLTVPEPSTPAPAANAETVRTHTQKTLLREAADAITEGNYAKARVLYAQLQASDPQTAAYGAALRIIDRHLAKPR